MRDSLTLPRMRVLINDTFFMAACADTGTSRTILIYDMAKKYGLKLYTARERLFAANGERMHCEGRTPFKIDFGRKSTRILALVTSAMKHKMLISLDDLEKMQILPESFPSILVRKDEQNSLEAMKELKKRSLKEYNQVFNDKLQREPMAGEPMEIHLKPSSVPPGKKVSKAAILKRKNDVADQGAEFDGRIRGRGPGPGSPGESGQVLPRQDYKNDEIQDSIEAMIETKHQVEGDQEAAKILRSKLETEEFGVDFPSGNNEEIKKLFNSHGLRSSDLIGGRGGSLPFKGPVLLKKDEEQFSISIKVTVNKSGTNYHSLSNLKNLNPMPKLQVQNYNVMAPKQDLLTFNVSKVILLFIFLISITLSITYFRRPESKNPSSTVKLPAKPKNQDNSIYC